MAKKEYKKRKKSQVRGTDLIEILTHDGRQKYTPEIVTVDDFAAQIGGGAGQGTTRAEGEVKMEHTIAWNMDSDATTTFNHNLSITEQRSMRELTVMIHDNDRITFRPLNCLNTSGALAGGVERVTFNDIILRRVTGGQFDGFAHNDALAYVTYYYIPD